MCTQLTKLIIWGHSDLCDLMAVASLLSTHTLDMWRLLGQALGRRLHLG